MLVGRHYERALGRLPARVIASATEALAAVRAGRESEWRPQRIHQLARLVAGASAVSLKLHSQYRVIYLVNGPTWFAAWVGSHEDYNHAKDKGFPV